MENQYEWKEEIIQCQEKTEQDLWVKALVEDIIEEGDKKEDASMKVWKQETTHPDKNVNARAAVMNNLTPLAFHVVRTNVQNVGKPW